MIETIFIHIKVLRGNYFLLISDNSKKLVFNKSCGNLGFKNINKRTKDAFQSLLSVGVQHILNITGNIQLFLKIEGAKKEILQQINNQFFNVLKNYNFKIFIIELINKISHNGCRKVYFRK
jgi:ribosomal protein S11